MPHAVTSDNIRLYFEEAGSGTPIIFLHEFAADYTNWEPQMRYFSRGHRCIAYSARGYTPSDVPSSADVYTYKHFYTDAIAVLDHLKIAKAHLVGLSMGSYSSLQIGLNAPERALSMTLAAVGSGSTIETSTNSASNAAPTPSNMKRSARWRWQRRRAKRRAGFRSC
jgi:3-oxoadipate enol-lactonase